MIYTNQKRRELNTALISKLPNPLVKINAEEGDSHIFLDRIPKNAERIMTEDCLIRNIPGGVHPWNQVLPVFIPSIFRGEKMYLVGYVNDSKESIQSAIRKLESCGLYYVPGLKLKKGVDYERI